MTGMPPREPRPGPEPGPRPRPELELEPEPSSEPVVDARGLRCPLPILRLAQALTGQSPGSTVTLLATDPAARTDVAAFARMRRLTLLETVERGDHTAYRVLIPDLIGSPTPPAGQPSLT